MKTMLPIRYYLSFFKWGVGFRQSNDPRTFGNNFTEWVKRVPNLQANVMLRGMAAMPAEYSG